MKRPRLGILTAMLCGCLSSCNSEHTMPDIVHIIYTSDAGPILPELQWHEQITISRATASLTRNGRAPETRINAGTWECALDEAAVAALFAQLSAIDCAAITRIEPDDPPDGGDSESYTIHYANNRQCVLQYDPGVTYTHGESIVGPIQAFILDLPLPIEAVSRYK